MPQDSLQVAADFAGSIALICLLSAAYGTVRRHMPGISMAPQSAGLVFGLVAALEMLAPMTPFPGLIIDLRNIPIVLSGAFLGLRGMLSCLVIAIGARVGIGGVGVVSGVVSMMLCGAAGVLWDQMTAKAERRGWQAMLGLVALMSVHLVAVVMLPYELMIWFLTKAAPPLMAIYAVVVPVSGLMFERERRLMVSEARLRAAARSDPEAAFPARDVLETQVSQGCMSGVFDQGMAVVHMAFQPGLAHAPFWGEDVHDLVAVSLHQRIAPLVPEGALVGQMGDGSVLFIAPEHMALGMDGLAARIRRDIAPAAIHVPGSVPSHPHVTVTRVDYHGIPDLDRVFNQLRGSDAPPPVPVPRSPDGSGDPRLFEMAERLIAHHRGRAKARLEPGSHLQDRG